MCAHTWGKLAKIQNMEVSYKLEAPHGTPKSAVSKRICHLQNIQLLGYPHVSSANFGQIFAAILWCCLFLTSELIRDSLPSPFFCTSFDQVVAYMKNVIGYRICMTRRWIGTYEDVTVDMTWHGMAWHDMTICLIKCAIVRDTESNLNGWSLTWHNTTWHRV